MFGPMGNAQIESPIGYNKVLAISGFKLTCTTTGAQTFTIQLLGAKAGKTIRVYWGDSNYNDYTGEASRSHSYAGAGTWNITITPLADINKMDFRDVKTSITINAANPLPPALTHLYFFAISVTWTVSASDPVPSTLTYLGGYSIAGWVWSVNSTNPMPSGLKTISFQAIGNITWTVSASAPMPSGLTSLTLYGMSGIAWSIDAPNPMPSGLSFLNISTYLNPNITWTVSATSPMPSGITYLYLANFNGLNWTVDVTNPFPTNLQVANLDNCNSLFVSPAQWKKNSLYSIKYTRSGMTQAQVDAVLQAIWENKENYTYPTPSLSLVSPDPTPSGVYQPASPPTTGLEYKYDLINGAYKPAGPEWTVQTA